VGNPIAARQINLKLSKREVATLFASLLCYMDTNRDFDTVMEHAGEVIQLLDPDEQEVLIDILRKELL